MVQVTYHLYQQEIVCHMVQVTYHLHNQEIVCHMLFFFNKEIKRETNTINNNIFYIQYLQTQHLYTIYK